MAALRAGYPLERAFTIGLGEKYRFRESLTRAKEELLSAKATVTKGYKNEDDLYETIEDIVLYADMVKKEMDSKRTKSNRNFK